VDSEFNLYAQKASAPQYVTGNTNPFAFAVYFQRIGSAFGVKPRTEMVTDASKNFAVLS
jgi:hypothetical protein